VLGSFGTKEYEALFMVNILNDDRLNWVLEQMGVSYTPRPFLVSVPCKLGTPMYKL
jgi:hypothetical protein